MKATQREDQKTNIYAREHHGYYTYVILTNYIYSMVSTPWRTLRTTPAGGNLPLITLLQIKQIYRYNRRNNKHTSSQITICLPPTYRSPPPPPHPWVESRKPLPPQSPHPRHPQIQRTRQHHNRHRRHRPRQRRNWGHVEKKLGANG
jgi:hypothetical protein